MKLASLFTSGMVLQQKKPIRVFGYGEGSVSVSFLGDEITATFTKNDLDCDGKWVVELPAHTAGGPHTMEITLNGESTTLCDVMIGEVIICSGQSNMEIPLMRSNGGFTEADSANDSLLRYFDLPMLYTKEPPVMSKQGKIYNSLEEVDKPWLYCTPENAPLFCAIGYYVAKILRCKLKVAVGVIYCAWGGKNIETFINLDEYLKYPEIANIAINYRNGVKDLDMEKYTAEYVEFVKVIGRYFDYAGNAEVDLCRKYGPLGPLDKITNVVWPESMMGGPFNSSRPGCLWETMISRLTPFSSRAVLWYQGETNVNDVPMNYSKKFEALLSCWRDSFKDDELPFYTVELCPYGNRFAFQGVESTNNGMAQLREEQQKCVKLFKNTYIVPTADCGEKYNIHPLDKVRVAERLAYSMLRHEYGFDIVGEGPMLKDWRVEGNKMILSFTGVTFFQPLIRPAEFLAICGEDKVFYPAEVEIGKITLTLTSEKVPSPIAARYNFWQYYTENGIYNEAQWPLHPFRTDNFEDATFAEIN